LEDVKMESIRRETNSGRISANHNSLAIFAVASNNCAIASVFTRVSQTRTTNSDDFAKIVKTPGQLTVFQKCTQIKKN